MKLPVSRSAFWVGLAWLRSANHWAAQEGASRVIIQSRRRQDSVAAGSFSVRPIYHTATETAGKPTADTR